MNIVLNGRTREVADGLSLTDLLIAMDLAPDRSGVAVARNGDVVVRASWAATRLGEGDRVEVLHAVQGG